MYTLNFKDVLNDGDGDSDSDVDGDGDGGNDGCSDCLTKNPAYGRQ